MKYGLCNCRNELVYYVVFPANFLSPCTVPDILIVILLLAINYLIYFRKERKRFIMTGDIVARILFSTGKTKQVLQDSQNLVIF